MWPKLTMWKQCYLRERVVLISTVLIIINNKEKQSVCKGRAKPHSERSGGVMLLRACLCVGLRQNAFNFGALRVGH